MSDTRIQQIIKRLYRKTLRDEIAWEPTVDEGEFQAAFADYTVRVSTRDRGMYANVPDYVIRVFNSDGQLLEEAATVDFEAERDNLFDTMKELYSGARRKALRVDDALSSILLELED